MRSLKKIFFIMFIILYPQVGLTVQYDFQGLNSEDKRILQTMVKVPLRRTMEGKEPTTVDKSFCTTFIPYDVTLANIFPSRGFPEDIIERLGAHLDGKSYRENGVPFGYMEETLQDPESGQYVVVKYEGNISSEDFLRTFSIQSGFLRAFVLDRVCQRNKGLMTCVAAIFNPVVSQEDVTFYNLKQLCRLLSYTLGGEVVSQEKNNGIVTHAIAGKKLVLRLRRNDKPEELVRRMRDFLTEDLRLTFTGGVLERQR